MVSPGCWVVSALPAARRTGAVSSTNLATQACLRCIEELAGAPIDFVSVGTERPQMVVRQEEG